MNNQTEQAAIQNVQNDMAKVIEYEVAGNKVQLSRTIVKNYLVRGAANSVSDQDVVSFMQICRYNQLNPFLNEAYLVAYGDSPQMVVSKEAYMKRADACDMYGGYEAGVIVERNGEVKELEGTFYLESDKLIGGWARVRRKDGRGSYMSVRLSEYDKKQSLWKEKPSTMIRKVALVQALREAFPSQLGAMYTSDEITETHTVDVAYEDVTAKVNGEVRNEELPMPGAVAEDGNAEASNEVKQEAEKPVAEEAPKRKSASRPTF